MAIEMCKILVLKGKLPGKPSVLGGCCLRAGRFVCVLSPTSHCLFANSLKNWTRSLIGAPRGSSCSGICIQCTHRPFLIQLSCCPTSWRSATNWGLGINFRDGHYISCFIFYIFLFSNFTIDLFTKCAYAQEPVPLQTKSRPTQQQVHSCTFLYFLGNVFMKKSSQERFAIYTSNGDFLLMSTCAKMLFKKQKINRKCRTTTKTKTWEKIE